MMLPFLRLILWKSGRPCVYWLYFFRKTDWWELRPETLWLWLKILKCVMYIKLYFNILIPLLLHYSVSDQIRQKILLITDWRKNSVFFTTWLASMEPFSLSAYRPNWWRQETGILFTFAILLHGFWKNSSFQHQDVLKMLQFT